MSAAVVEVEVDLSDLALLDDGRRHAYCSTCYAAPALGVPFVAWCGARAVNLRHGDWPENAVPPNACRNCLTAKTGECGHRQITP